MSFQILEHVDKLSPAKKKGRYICPVCDGHNLTIAKDGLQFTCWNGCDHSAIREALAPRQEGQRTTRSQYNLGKPKKQVKPVLLPEKINLARLPQPATDSPQPQKRFDSKHGEVQEWTYYYTPDKWKVRTQWSDASRLKGYDKSFFLWHRDASGKAIAKAGEGIRPPYRMDEAIAAVKASTANAVMGVEGENAVESYRQMGLACITLSGFSKDELILMAQLLKDVGLGLIYHPDHDQTGQNKAAKIQEACDRVGVPCIVLDPISIHPDLPESGDVVEMLAVMEVPDFIERLEIQIRAGVEARRGEPQLEDEFKDIPDSLDPDTEFTQRALSFLYGDRPWICADDKLYFWTGSHYKHSPDAVERPKIASFCNCYPVEQKDGSIRYPYAKPAKVREVLQWVKDRLEVDPNLLNPPGLNCTNGVLQLSWSGSVPSWQFVKHDPSQYYTYEPVATYNPQADSTNCDRLLSVLDTPEQEIFLRTIAASLDLGTVRKYKGRLVRALLLKGHGANGKDTLREVVAAMYGYQGITSATLTDFAMYDSGRKFPLARTSKARVNWASENANFSKIDQIQSLKAFITGDSISKEGKGKDECEFTPVGVALFNVNDVPNIQGSLEAILGRYGVLTFNKTFKIGADPGKGEIEADSRFKYDPEFLRTEVLPAFLNRVLQSLENLMRDGIDYKCTQRAMEAIQAENSHLFQFCQDTGLDYDPNGKLTAGEIWQHLEQWYLDNGTLNYEENGKGKKKAIWLDQAKRGDANVRGANQVIARFQSLFPKTKRGTITNGADKNRTALYGIGFKVADNRNQMTEVSQPPYQVSQLVSQLETPKPLLDKDYSQSGKPGKPVSIVDDKNKIDSTELKQPETSDCEKVNPAAQLPYLTYNPDCVSNAALPNDLPTALLDSKTALPEMIENRTQSAIATPASINDSPTVQGEVSQIQATQIQPPPPMPITKAWYVGQRVMFWLGVGRRWAEATILQVHNDTDGNFLKVVVGTADGFWQNVWEESGLMPFPLEEAKKS